MKGHTKIELKDVNTGEVKVVEEDNMVTSALKRLLFVNPLLANPVADNDSTIIGNLIGGILLLEDAIDEKINTCCVPAGNKMTARGVHGLAYSGVVTECGSFSINESGLQEDGSVRLVYDFNSSQGNGQISCVSLTSKSGGKMGIGDNIENVDVQTISDIEFNAYGEIKSNIVNPYLNLVLLSSVNNIAVYFTTGYRPTVTRTIEFKVYDAPISSISVFGKSDYSSFKSYLNVIPTERLIKTFSVELPEKVLSCFGTSGSSDVYRGGYVPYFFDGKIRIILGPYSSNIAPKGVAYLCIIDPITETIDVKDIVNNSLGSMALSSNSYLSSNNTYAFGWANQVAVTQKYLIAPIFVDGGWKLYRINIEDNTDIVDLGFTKFTEDSNTIPEIYFRFITEEFVYFEYGRSNDNTYVYKYVINVLAGEVKRTNVTYIAYINSTQHSSQVHGNDLLLVNAWRNGSSNGNSLYAHPVPLITINNLSEPVVKTASQTMKVTYTISES